MGRAYGSARKYDRLRRAALVSVECDRRPGRRNDPTGRNMGSRWCKRYLSLHAECRGRPHRQHGDGLQHFERRDRFSVDELCRTFVD